MSVNAGNADCTSGMSGAIYDALIGDSRNGFANPLPQSGQDAVKAICWAIAQKVCDAVNESGSGGIGPGPGGTQPIWARESSVDHESVFTLAQTLIIPDSLMVSVNGKLVEDYTFSSSLHRVTLAAALEGDDEVVFRYQFFGEYTVN